MGGKDMEDFKRGTMIAAVVLSGIFIIGIPATLISELGLMTTLCILALILFGIWGSRLGANAVYRGIFAKGQEDERGKDTDFI
jgi:steroid 5-alpha reductase family enzyme